MCRLRQNDELCLHIQVIFNPSFELQNALSDVYNGKSSSNCGACIYHNFQCCIEASFV